MAKRRNRKGDRGGRRNRYDESIELPRDSIPVVLDPEGVIDQAYPAGTPIDRIMTDLKVHPRAIDESRRVEPSIGSDHGKQGLPMMDLAHAFTFGKKFDGNALDQRALNVLRKYRMELRRSEKFVLDDDAVRLICDLSVEAVEKDKGDSLLRGWAYLARLPYDDFWVEMSLHAKVRRMAELGTLRIEHPNLREISPTIAYQFSRDDESGSPTRWIARDYILFKDRISPGLLAYVFDPEATELEPVRSSRKWRSTTLSARPEIGKIPGRLADGSKEMEVDPEDVLLGTLQKLEELSTRQKEATVSMDVVSSGIGAPGWLRAKLAAIVDPFWEAYGSRYVGGRVFALIAMEVMEQAGTARWLISMLAAINAIPRDVVPVPARPGRRHVGANVLPYFQHRTLRLRLPRDDRIVHVLERAAFAADAARNAPRPWHRVRGHWRIVERGVAKGRRRGQAWCRHVPAATDEAGLGRCGRCGLLIRWVAQHHRGDPTLGIVEHTYVATTGKGR